MIDYYDAEETDEENINDKVKIFALSLNPKELKDGGYINKKVIPTQHIKLFLPLFIEEIKVNDIYEHPRLFGFSKLFISCFFKLIYENEIILGKSAAKKFEDILSIEDENTRCEFAFTFLAEFLDEQKVANEFMEWFLKNIRDEEMKNLFLLRSIDKEAFAVYEHHILGINNKKVHRDNVDRIAGLLFLDEIINYLVYYSGDSRYMTIGNEVKEIWEKKTQFGEDFIFFLL